MERSASAVWNGDLKDGKGSISTQSGLLSEAPYSFVTRFENGKGTNPEELIAAAHAGCFTMATSFALGAAGFTPDTLETSCVVTLENGSITSSHLTLTAKVPGISKEQFDTVVKGAKETCPISKLFNTQIDLEATLL